MENAFMRWWGCGAFEVILGDVNIAFDPYLFNENLESAEPIYDYIFISHEHFDHCHPPTLQKLCQGGMPCPGQEHLTAMESQGVDSAVDPACIHGAVYFKLRSQKGPSVSSC